MERVPGKTPDNNESAAARSNHERNGPPHSEREGEQVPYSENTPQGKLIQKLQAPSAGRTPQGKLTQMLQAPSAGQSQTPQGKLIQKLEAPLADKEELASEEDTLQKKSSGEGPASPPSEGSGSGSSLPKTVRSEMENAFRSDFSGVRIHTESIKSLNVGALAFTQGHDIHFSPGQYRPESQKGKELLGHELAHVQQQREGRVRPTTQAKGLPVNDDPALEKEADEMGSKAAKGEVVQGKSTAPAQLPETAALQKKEGEEKDEEQSPIGVFDPEGDTVALYDAPDEGAAVIAQIPNLTEVSVLSANASGAWGHVGVALGQASHTGYVRSKYLSYQLDEVVIGDKAEPIHRFDIVEMETHVHQSSDSKSPVITTLRKGERIFLIEPHNTWYKVRTEGGEIGFVGAYRVNGNMPDPNAKLCKIPSGKKGYLENIIKENYSDFVKGRDMRDYARAIMHVNNPTNNKEKGIYKNGEFSLWHTYSEYNQYVLKEGLEIWVPGQGFADTLLNRFDNTSSATHDLAQGAKDKLVAPMISMVDRIWPEGWGLGLEAGLGLTFGIPIGANLQTTTHFYRKDKDTIALRKSADVRAGLDTGASAGFYLGSKGGGGIGGEVGVDAEIKGGLFSMLEYEFPFKEDLSIISLMIALKGAGSPIMMVSSFLDMFFNIGLSPMQYLTKSKQSIGVKASAEAAAQIGARKDTAGRGRYAESNGRNGSMADDAASTYRGGGFSKEGARNMLLRMLEQKLGAGIFANANVGVELDIQESTKNRRTGIREPSKAQADVFIEGDVAASLQIPVLTGVNLGAGVGAKLGFTYENGKWGDLPKVRFYTYQGEMDLYEGPASETEATLGNTDVRNWKPSDLADYFHALKIKRRYALPMDIVARYAGLKAKQEGVKRMMKREYQGWGAYVENYLTLEFDLGKNSLEKLTEEFAGLIHEIRRMGYDRVLEDFDKFLRTGEIPEIIGEIIKILFSADVLTAAEWHFEGGGGLAAGAKLSAGAKGRLDANASAAVTYTADVKEAVLGAMQSESVLDFLRRLMGASPEQEPLDGEGG